MTAQLNEEIILDGEVALMDFVPPLPPNHPRIFKVDSNEVDWGAAMPSYILHSTGCMRGYQGTWEIKDGLLYLVGLRGHLKLREGVPLLADWVTGEFRISKKALLQSSFVSIFLEKILVKVRTGVVISAVAIDNRKA